jgi:hypothetical protein
MAVIRYHLAPLSARAEDVAALLQMYIDRFHYMRIMMDYEYTSHNQKSVQLVDFNPSL